MFGLDRQPPGLAAIQQAKQDGLWTIYDDIEDLIIPGDLAPRLIVETSTDNYSIDLIASL